MDARSDVETATANTHLSLNIDYIPSERPSPLA